MLKSRMMVCAAALIAIGCAETATEPHPQVPAIADARQALIHVCHAFGNGGWRLTIVAAASLPDHFSHGDGVPGGAVPGMVGFVFDAMCGLNALPIMANQSFNVDENSANGTAVGTIVFSDPDPFDMVTLAVTGGTGNTAFSVNPNTGDISVADQSQLDFETTPSFTLLVEASDLDGATTAATMTINLNNLPECINSEATLLAAAAAGGSFCVATGAAIVLSGEVMVNTALSLTSAGVGNAVIDANQTGRVFTVGASGNLTMTDVTVTGGRNAAFEGGGIRIAGGTVTLNGSATVTGNVAWNGAGVYITFAGGSLVMNDASTVSSNSALDLGSLVSTAGGGVLVNAPGSLTMNGASTISGNRAQGALSLGGGLVNNAGSITMNGTSAISGNVAGPASAQANQSLGGGVYFVNGGSLSLNNAASITGNSAVIDGGGIFRIDGGSGTISGVTAANVTGNTPNNCGGPVAVPGCAG